jgi:PcfJ-like protein
VSRRKKKTSSQEANRQWIEERRAKLEKAEAVRQDAVQREARLRAAFARPASSTARLIERVLVGEPQGRRTDRLALFLRILEERAPRLLTNDTAPALKRMAAFDWVQSPSDWQPLGKGRDTLFRSLAEHLFARFRMPPMLWTAFFDEESGPTLARIAVHVGAGHSLYDAVGLGLLPVPLTRRMCHELLADPGEATFLAAIRRVQVRAVGGTSGLGKAWMGTRAGGRLHDRASEEFWLDVLAWFAKNPLPHADVTPLTDYIEGRRAATGSFSMKGRTATALTRDMRAWHEHLARQEAIHGRRFEPSGFDSMDVARARRDAGGREIRETWHFREVLDSKTLAGEGRAMGHCVYSYAWRVEKGECSIWTLTLEDETGHWRMLTIEVRNALRRVVQARGRFNRQPEARELPPLREWVGHNNLEISSDCL